MEIDFRKYNLSEVRESARDYIRMLDQVYYNYSSTAIQQLGSKEHPIPEIVAEAVIRLHNAIAAIDRDAVIEVFSRYKDFSENDPRILVVDAKSALEDLLPLIKIAKKGRLFIAKRIDPNLKQLRQDCTDMITWLDKQLATLNERDYMTPTLDEVACFEDLLEIDAIEWLNWNIFIPELSLSGRKRLLIIALATNSIDEEKKAKLREALTQVEEQIEHQQQIPATAMRTTKTRDKTFSDLIQYQDKDALLKRLHFLIDGKSGADVGAVLLKAQQQGYLTECPTRAEYESEFSLVGSWQAIHNYMNPGNSNALVKANKIIIF